jgi:hypothetical protein
MVKNKFNKIKIQDITYMIHKQITYHEDFCYIPTTIGEVSLFMVLIQSRISYLKYAFQ